MDIKLRQKVFIYVTPEWLRSLANKADKVWFNKEWGGSLSIGKFCNKDIDIEFVVDQKNMEGFDG